MILLTLSYVTTDSKRLSHPNHIPRWRGARSFLPSTVRIGMLVPHVQRQNKREVMMFADISMSDGFYRRHLFHSRTRVRILHFSNDVNSLLLEFTCKLVLFDGDLTLPNRMRIVQTHPFSIQASCQTNDLFPPAHRRTGAILGYGVNAPANFPSGTYLISLIMSSRMFSSRLCIFMI